MQDFIAQHSIKYRLEPLTHQLVNTSESKVGILQYVKSYQQSHTEPLCFSITQFEKLYLRNDIRLSMFSTEDRHSSNKAMTRTTI